MAPQVVIESTQESQELMDLTVKAIADGKGNEARIPEKKAETPGAAPAETGSESGTEQPGSKEGSPKAGEEQITPGMQKRFDRLTRERREAEEKAAALEERIKKLEGGKTAEPEAPSDPEPDENGVNPKTGKAWKDWKEFSREHAAWAYRQAQAEGDAAKEEQTEAEQAQSHYDAHLDRVSEARTKHADFDDVIASAKPLDSTVATKQAFNLAIVEADNGPEVMYHLATHPEELEKLAKMSPVRVQMEVGRISAALGEPSGSKPPAPKEKPVSKAPAPITPVSTSTSSAPKSLADLAKENPDEYIRRRNKEEAESRRRR